jgi:M6 family metalloprotease-like protein
VLVAALLFPAALAAGAEAAEPAKPTRVAFRPLSADPSPAAESRRAAWNRFPCYLGPDGQAVRVGGARPLRTAAAGKAPLLPVDATAAPGRRSAITGTTGATGPADLAASHVDTLRVAFLRVDFRTDRSGDLTTSPDGRFDLRRDVDLPVDPPPHDRAYFESHGEALARYYRAQSFGHLEIVSTVFPTEADSAFHLGDAADYGPWAVVADNVDVANEAERLIKDALEAARASGQVDFPAFDAFIIVHAGSDFQSDVNGDSPNDIPTFVLEFGDTVIVDGKHIERAMVLPETTTQDGFLGALNGVLAHEFGHILRLPDLYNTRTGVPSVGYWSIMDSGHNIGAILVDADESEFEVFGALPSSFDAWTRLQLFLPEDSPGGGFLAPRIAVVGDSLTTSLRSVLEDSRFVLCELHDTEYYLIENRATELDGNGFPIIRADSATGVILGPEADSTVSPTLGALEYDALLPGGGLLVWHVDDRVLFGDLADPFGINTRIQRRGVRIVEADGIEDQGRRNFGTPWDPFFASNNGHFGPFTVPRTHTNDGQFSRVEMTTPSEPGPLMELSVTRPTHVDGWPIGLVEDVTVTATTLLDVTGDGRPELFFSVGRDLIAIEGRGGRPFPAPPPDDPGAAVPWARASANLDSRIAAVDAGRTGPDAGRPALLVARSAGQDRILAWDAAAAAVPADAMLPATGAATPPALLRETPVGSAVTDAPVAYAGYDGRAHLAGILEGPTRLARLWSTSPALIGIDPDEPVGNVVYGPLSSAAGGVEVAWLTASGRVHCATSIEAFPGQGPGGVGLLRTLGASEPLGMGSRLSLLAANFRGPDREAYDLAVVDRAGTATLLDLQCAPLPGWPVDLPAPMLGSAAAGDLDGDGAAELVLADTLGQVVVLNGDGSNALGFPRPLGARAVSGPMLVDLDGRPGFEILLATDDGALHAFDRDGRPVTGFPIGLGSRRPASAYLADLDGDDILDLVAGSEEHQLLATALAAEIPDSLIAWRGEANGPTRNAVLDRRAAGRGGSNPTADRAGTLVCFPNPARGDAMNFRIVLSPGQSATASVHDLLGRPIAQGLRPDGAGLEANITWPLDGVAPGVYLVRVSIDGDGGDTQVRLVSVLR